MKVRSRRTLRRVDWEERKRRMLRRKSRSGDQKET